jgi:5'-phosphate synthase pdxT subunit
VIGVLALQGGVAEHLAALERSGAIARPVRRPEELAEVDGLVLPGGESTTMTRLLATFDLFEPLRERLQEGMPAFGSCAGMVLLGSDVLDEHGEPAPAVRPLGGLDMVVRRNAFGRQVESFEEDLDFAGIDDGPVHAVFIRAPWVDKIGSEVDVLAEASPRVEPHVTSGGKTTGRIVAVRQGPVLATAFHPELVSGDDRVHRLFVQTVRAG